MVTHAWQDFSGGYTTVDICSRDGPRLGGAKAFTPSVVRARFAASKPSADDPGELLGLEGRKFRRVLVPEGQKLWLRALDTQRDVVMARS